MGELEEASDPPRTQMAQNPPGTQVAQNGPGNADATDENVGCGARSTSRRAHFTLVTGWSGWAGFGTTRRP
jgi:hypothetical protein